MCSSFRIPPPPDEEPPVKILLLSIVTSAKTVSHNVLFRICPCRPRSNALPSSVLLLYTLTKLPKSSSTERSSSTTPASKSSCHTVSRSQPLPPLHQRNFSVSPPFPLAAVTLNRSFHCSLAFSSLSSTSSTHFLTHCGHRPPMSLYASANTAKSHLLFMVMAFRQSSQY